MNWVLLTFNDLIFKADKISKLNIAVIEEFINGYGVRVEETVDGYNLIVLKNKIEYNKTYLQKKYLNSLTKSEITDRMIEIQKFGRQTY
tara:strand:+ start:742 stop:1008 length:267 start_codon:yes stop_codon:yes gene_type:complete